MSIPRCHTLKSPVDADSLLPSIRQRRCVFPSNSTCHQTPCQVAQKSAECPFPYRLLAGRSTPSHTLTSIATSVSPPASKWARASCRHYRVRTRGWLKLAIHAPPAPGTIHSHLRSEVSASCDVTGYPQDVTAPLRVSRVRLVPRARAPPLHSGTSGRGIRHLPPGLRSGLRSAEFRLRLLDGRTQDEAEAQVVEPVVRIDPDAERRPAKRGRAAPTAAPVDPARAR